MNEHSDTPITSPSPGHHETDETHAGAAAQARRSRWPVVLVAAAALALGFAVGALARPAATSTDEYRAVAADLASATSDLTAARGTSSSQAQRITQYQSAESSVAARESKAADKEKGFAQREQDVAKKEADLSAKEKAFEDRQKVVAQSQISNGLHVVGKDVQPGVYSTAGGSGSNPVGCYYAWKSGTGSDADIVDNNIVKGPATVTLRDGEVFESSSCAVWTKQG